MTQFVESPRNLSRQDCLDRLGQAPLARVIISVRCLPMALPARMALRDAESLVLASADPAIWLTASRHDVVTVQIDGVDADNHTWSVVAAGLASPASEGEVAEVLAEEVLRGAHLIEVPLSVVYGQRN